MTHQAMDTRANVRFTASLCAKVLLVMVSLQVVRSAPLISSPAGLRSKSSFLCASAAVASKASDTKTKTLSQRTAQVKQYLQEKGIDIKSIPKAIILYEITSAGFMFGIWGLCYLMQPVQRGLLVAKLAQPGAFESALAKGQQLMRESKRKNAMRLVTAYAEGAVVRSAVKPLIIPAKLFLTWKFQQAVDALVALRRGRAASPAPASPRQSKR